MNAFQTLGISADADIQAIKKAYATLLRQHRPDDDPAGFQRVHEAYQACMAHAQRAALRQQQRAQSRQPNDAEGGPVDAEGNKAAPADSPVASLQPVATALASPVAGPQVAQTPERAAAAEQSPPGPVSLATKAQPTGQSRPVANATAPVDRPPPRPPADPISADTTFGAPRTVQFRLEDFVVALCERDEVDHLHTWLQRCEPLYALGLKQAITAPLLQILSRRAKPLSPDGLQAVLAFFGLNTVSPERRSLEALIQLLESRSRAAWSIRIRSEPSLPAVRSARIKRSTPPGWLDKIVAHELVKPRNLFRRAAVLLIPGFSPRMRRLLAEISVGIDPSKDPTFNQAAVQFWRDALDPTRVSKWLIVSMCARVCVFLAILSSFADASVGPAGYVGIGTLMFCGWLAVAAMNASKGRKATTKAPGRLDRYVAREFHQPRNVFRRAVILLVPGFRGSMRRAIALMPRDAGSAGNPAIDKKALDFWRKAFDPMHVSKWRILSVCVYICAIILIVGVGSQDLALVGGYAVIGLVFLCGWWALAANDAHKLRKANPPGPAAWRTGRTNRSTGGSTPWRWIVAAIIGLNALIHALTNQ